MGWKLVHGYAALMSVALLVYVSCQLFDTGNLTIQAEPVARNMSALNTITMVLWFVCVLASALRALKAEIGR